VTGSKSFTGVAVNDAPTATNLNAPETYTEDTPLNLTDILVADVDSSTLTATLTLSDSSVGALSTGTFGGVTSTFDVPTGTWTATGSAADVNAALAAVTFNPALNFNGSFTVATSVSDGVDTVTGSKSFAGIAVNDAPTATNLSAAESYTEDTPLNPDGHRRRGCGQQLRHRNAGAVEHGRRRPEHRNFRNGDFHLQRRDWHLDGQRIGDGRQRRAGRSDIQSRAEFQRQLHRSPPASAMAWLPP
jgi:hypothetical protein